MYLSLELVELAIEKIKTIHPFFGIDFLVAKEIGLPVGKAVDVSLDSITRQFMDFYFKPFPASAYYYRYYRKPNDDHWWDAKYPGSTSQSRRTRGHFSHAFIHDTNKPRLWGWQSDYIQILKNELPKNQKIPVFYLAIWLFRDAKWEPQTEVQDIINEFINKFEINPTEINNLFDVTLPTDLENVSVFDAQPVSLINLIKKIGIPPDLPEEGGGILSYLELKGVGPAKRLKFEPAKRINLITGDNGVGKTFLLDTAWWALTGQWIDYPADPTNKDPKEATITYTVSGEYTESNPITVKYDSKRLAWPNFNRDQAIPSLLIYAKADNSFVIWDPAQHYHETGARETIQRPYVFTPKDVWLGLEDAERHSICEGLLRDWVRWQDTQAEEFSNLVRVLKHLSPKDMGELKPGKPTRVPGEKRPIPTLAMPYGDVAVIYVSEGMRRIISLAYLLVWAWSEHRTASLQSKSEPQRRMVMLIDELEAHLHPKWQRLILPSLVQVQSELSDKLEVQFLIATHSPLVMASSEPIFDTERDKVFNMELAQQNMFYKEVILKEIPFIKLGVVDAWLTSDFFELGQPRSSEAETAIIDAKNIQLENQPSSEKVQEIHQRLAKYLASDDEFWPRWLYFAETHGVKT